jgi:hypothetical protein
MSTIPAPTKVMPLILEAFTSSKVTMNIYNSIEARKVIKQDQKQSILYKRTLETSRAR